MKYYFLKHKDSDEFLMHKTELVEGSYPETEYRHSLCTADEGSREVWGTNSLSVATNIINATKANSGEVVLNTFEYPLIREEWLGCLQVIETDPYFLQGERYDRYLPVEAVLYAYFSNFTESSLSIEHIGIIRLMYYKHLQDSEYFPMTVKIEYPTDISYIANIRKTEFAMNADYIYYTGGYSTLGRNIEVLTFGCDMFKHFYDFISKMKPTEVWDNLIWYKNREEDV